MKRFIVLALLLCAGCSAGTLTVTRADGTRTVRRVLDCDMRTPGEVRYTGMDREPHVITDYRHALYENRFITRDFVIEPGCCGQP
ncbi:MAG TPA: hypothetical protein VF795_11655 [Desulfuromonadaceae bacterium]